MTDGTVVVQVRVREGVRSKRKIKGRQLQDTMELRPLLFAVLAFAAWRYVQSMMSNSVRAAIAFDKARGEVRTGTCSWSGTAAAAPASGPPHTAVRIKDMSPWTEVCVAKRTGEGTVEVWQPGAPTGRWFRRQFGRRTPAAWPCARCGSEQQRSVLQAQFDSVVQQIEAAGTANALDAVFVLYRQTKTSNPRPPTRA